MDLVFCLKFIQMYMAHTQTHENFTQNFHYTVCYKNIIVLGSGGQLDKH